MRCPSIAATPQHISVEGAAERISRLIKKSVQGAVRRFGYQLTRFPAPESYDAQIGRYLRHIGANIVLDVGAHEGSFLAHMVRLAPEGRHVACEPLPDYAARLRSGFPGVTLHEAALSDAEGTASFSYAVSYTHLTLPTICSV